MFEQISQEIAGTSASAFVANHLWVTPAVQSIHILAIAALSGALLMISFRLLGLSAADQTMEMTARRFGPVVWSAGVVLLISGIVLVIGEPSRELPNPLFQAKMVLVVIIMIAASVFVLASNRSSDAWQGLSGKILAIALVGLWVAIIFAGRWIAYV